MRFVDVAAPPGTGKSTLCDHFHHHRWPDWDGLPPPEEWKDFISEVNRLVALVKDHKNCFGQPTLQAVIRMNERSLKKMATVHRDNGIMRWANGSTGESGETVMRPYIQTGFIQRGLGFGWRLVDMGADLRETRRFYELMPVSLGVAFLKASLTTIFERNEAREKVAATQHENRSFQVPLMIPAIEYAKEVLAARGVPMIEIDVEHQSPSESRKQLLAFADETARHAA
jgi:hypothetical protein